VPIGVVIPRTPEDVITTVALCREHGVPILSRGGGTSLAGQTCNHAVVIDWSKYLNRILSIDPERRIAVVEPGVVLDDLRDAAEVHGLTFGPDPATHNRNSLGGMIGNNSCGVHSVMAGRTADNVEQLEILTYDGLELTVGATGEEELATIIRDGGRRGEIYAGMRDIRDQFAERIRACYPDIPRRVSGYNLAQLLPENGFNVARALVGSEGTCVLVLAAHLNLVPNPPHRRLAVLGFEDVYAAADRVPDVLAHGPVGLEGVDDRLVEYMRRRNLHPDALAHLPEGNGWLLVEMGGRSAEEAEGRARAVVDDLRQAGTLVDAYVAEGEEAKKIWEVREAGLAATAHVPGMADAWPGWEDAAIDPARAGDYLRDFRKLLERYDYHGSVYGHFGDGCIHVRIDFDLPAAPGWSSTAASWTRPQTWCSPMGGPSPVSTATARPAPSSCPRCSARS
jgi:FAD/FMN-containing dehydrogenase